MMAFLRRRRRCSPWSRLVAPLRRLSAARDRRRALGSRSTAPSSAVSGASAWAIGLNEGSSSPSARSGSRPTMSSGSSSSNTTTKAATSAMTASERCAPLMPMPGASRAVAATVTSAQQQPDRNEQQHRVVEIRAQRVRTSAALGEQPQRQPHQRAERRFDGAEIDAAQASRKMSSGIIGVRPLDEALLAAALPPQPSLDPRHARRRPRS